MRTFWLYTLARLGILVVVAGVLWLAGARGVLLIVLAFFVSMLISYWALGGMRERLASGVQARAERINERIDAANRAEDEAVEADAATPSEHGVSAPDHGTDEAGSARPTGPDST